MKPIVFVLSTGRAGTKFVAELIRDAYPKNVESWHERLTIQTRARKYFRKYDKESLDSQRKCKAIGQMIREIKNTSKKKAYIDTGWTLHSLFPLFLEEFGEQVHFVFQVRHPFDSSASQAIKGAYREEWVGLDRWVEYCFLHPSDNVFHPDVKWSSMTPFQKSLWRWGELALYWEELQHRYPQGKWYVLRSEDIFSDIGNLNLYFELLSLPSVSPDKLISLKRKADRNETNTDWRYWYGLKTGEWKKYYNFPWVLQLATKYGYSSDRNVIRNKASNYARPLDICGRIVRRLSTCLFKG